MARKRPSSSAVVSRRCAGWFRADAFCGLGFASHGNFTVLLGRYKYEVRSAADKLRYLKTPGLVQ